MGFPDAPKFSGRPEKLTTTNRLEPYLRTQEQTRVQTAEVLNVHDFFDQFLARIKSDYFQYLIANQQEDRKEQLRDTLREFYCWTEGMMKYFLNRPEGSPSPLTEKNVIQELRLLICEITFGARQAGDPLSPEALRAAELDGTEEIISEDDEAEDTSFVADFSTLLDELLEAVDFFEGEKESISDQGTLTLRQKDLFEGLGWKEDFILDQVLHLFTIYGDKRLRTLQEKIRKRATDMDGNRVGDSMLSWKLSERALALLLQMRVLQLPELYLIWNAKRCSEAEKKGEGYKVQVRKFLWKELSSLGEILGWEPLMRNKFFHSLETTMKGYSHIDIAMNLISTPQGKLQFLYWIRDQLGKSDALLPFKPEAFSDLIWIFQQKNGIGPAEAKLLQELPHHVQIIETPEDTLELEAAGGSGFEGEELYFPDPLEDNEEEE